MPSSIKKQFLDADSQTKHNFSAFSKKKMFNCAKEYLTPLDALIDIMLPFSIKSYFYYLINYIHLFKIIKPRKEIYSLSRIGYRSSQKTKI
jgi:hypothetical protein